MIEDGIFGAEQKEKFVKYFKTASFLTNRDWYIKEYTNCIYILEKDIISKKDMFKLVNGVKHMVTLFNGAYDSKYNKAFHRASL